MALGIYALFAAIVAFMAAANAMDDRAIDFVWSNVSVPWKAEAATSWPLLSWTDSSDGLLFVSHLTGSASGAAQSFCYTSSFDGDTWTPTVASVIPPLASPYYSTASLMVSQEKVFILTEAQQWLGTNMWECDWSTSTVPPFGAPPGPTRYGATLQALSVGADTRDAMVYGGGSLTGSPEVCASDVFGAVGHFNQWQPLQVPLGALTSDCRLNLLSGSAGTVFIFTAFAVYSSLDLTSWTPVGATMGSTSTFSIIATSFVFPAPNATATVFNPTSIPIWVSAFAPFVFNNGSGPVPAQKPQITTSLDMLSWSPYFREPFPARYSGGGILVTGSGRLAMIGGATGGLGVQPLLEVWLASPFVIPSNSPTPSKTPSSSGTASSTPTQSPSSTVSPSSTQTASPSPSQCPFGYYGSSCSSCPGPSGMPCNGHGQCDGGGTRSGTGSCSCNVGYSGGDCAIQVGILGGVMVSLAIMCIGGGFCWRARMQRSVRHHGMGPDGYNLILDMPSIRAPWPPQVPPEPFQQLALALPTAAPAAEVAVPPVALPPAALPQQPLVQPDPPVAAQTPLALPPAAVPVTIAPQAAPPLPPQLSPAAFQGVHLRHISSMHVPVCTCGVCFDDTSAGVRIGACGDTICYPCGLRLLRGISYDTTSIVCCAQLCATLDEAARTTFSRDAVETIAWWSMQPRADAAGELRPLSGEQIARIMAVFPAPLPAIESGDLPGVKQCPSCRQGIYRPRGHGCHHVKCPRGGGGCGHEFCIVCLATWASHPQPNTCGLFCHAICDCQPCLMCDSDSARCPGCDRDGRCPVCPNDRNLGYQDRAADPGVAAGLVPAQLVGGRRHVHGRQH